MKSATLQLNKFQQAHCNNRTSLQHIIARLRMKKANVLSWDSNPRPCDPRSTILASFFRHSQRPGIMADQQDVCTGALPCRGRLFHGMVCPRPTCALYPSKQHRRHCQAYSTLLPCPDTGMISLLTFTRQEPFFSHTSLLILCLPDGVARINLLRIFLNPIPRRRWESNPRHSSRVKLHRDPGPLKDALPTELPRRG